MLDSESNLQFLRMGLSKYPGAWETVDYFEKSVVDALFAAFEAKKNWQNVQPMLTSGHMVPTKLIGSVDRAISAYIVATLPRRNDGADKVYIWLGLYWNRPRRPAAQVVAVCSVSDEKNRPIRLLELAGRDQRVTLGPVNKKSEQSLLIEPGDEFDPAETFSLLLDAADEALGADAAALA